MAAMHARGELAVGETFVHESIVGSLFRGEIIEELSVSGGDGKPPIKAVRPTISGQAWITQFARVVVHPTDPFPSGYRVADIWA